MSYELFAYTILSQGPPPLLPKVTFLLEAPISVMCLCGPFALSISQTFCMRHYFLLPAWVFSVCAIMTVL